MKIYYRNTQEDFRAYYDHRYAGDKERGRAEYWRSFVWYFAVLALGIFISLRNEERFAACIFATLAMMYGWQNWSYNQTWGRQADTYSQTVPPQRCVLQIDENGLVESFPGIVLRVPWEQMHRYAVLEKHLIFQFLLDRAFIIPFRDLVGNQKDDLIHLLVQRRLQRAD